LHATHGAAAVVIKFDRLPGLNAVRALVTELDANKAGLSHAHVLLAHIECVLWRFHRHEQGLARAVILDNFKSSVGRLGLRVKLPLNAVCEAERAIAVCPVAPFQSAIQHLGAVNFVKVPAAASAVGARTSLESKVPARPLLVRRVLATLLLRLPKTLNDNLR
jgi:hypothetical protein